MKTILVVDDNLDNRTIIAHMLTIGGFHSITAASGYQAIALAECAPPDLILMDLAMPDLDGWSATAQIKARADLAHVPVIAVTGHVTRDELERALRAGCVDYLPKPIDFDTMLQKVRKHMAA